MSRVAAPLGTLVAVGAAFGYVARVDPAEPGHYPACPVLALAGVNCPGCGGLRSAHAFAHGDFAAALGSNALAVVVFAGFACFWARWLLRALRGGAPPALPGPAARPVLWWLAGAVVVAFTVVRNMPLGSVLAP